MITKEVLDAITTQYSSDMMPESAKAILTGSLKDAITKTSCITKNDLQNMIGTLGLDEEQKVALMRRILEICTKNDNVNHPSHYETGKFECIDVMLETQGIEAVKNFCICNAFKYLYRHCGKNGLEDVKKAGWYIRKYIELEEGNVNGDREQGN